MRPLSLTATYTHRTVRNGLAIVVLLLVAAAGLATAQETTTGSVQGRIVDPQGLPVPGATVTVTSAQGTKTFTTDAQGRYFAPFLTPGMYTIRAELQGFKPIEQRNVDVRLGQRIEVNLTMTVGGLTETVEVAATAPTVDTTSTTIGANLDTELLTRVPVQRRFSDTLYLAPGVSSSGTAGQANPSVSGASGLENQYIIDGVNITDPGYGALGAYSIVFGSLGSATPFDFIKEVQVQTGGYAAEYGQATGGVINVVTKSGTNQLRGSAFTYIQPDQFESEYKTVVSTSRPEAVNLTASRLNDVGVEIGGPVIRDRLFFFGAVDPQWDRRTYIAPEGFPLRALGEVSRDRRIVPYSAKGTFLATPAHRFDVSVFGDPSRGLGGIQRRTALLRTEMTGESELEYGGNNQTVRYDGSLGSRWLVEASVGRAANIMRETPTTSQWSTLNATTLERTGGVGFFEENEGQNIQFQVKSTNLVNFGGQHQIRYGVVYEDVEYDQLANYSGPTFTLPNGERTATGATISILADPTFGQIYRVTRAYVNPVRSTEQQYASFFVQDTYQIGNRLTIRPGIRYEQQKLQGNLSDFTWDGNWAPRIGAILDPMGNGRMRVFANWGRFYARVPNDLAARAMSAEVGASRADYFDPGLTQPIPSTVTAAGTTRHYVPTSLSPADIDAESKMTHHDETVAGVEFDIGNGISLGARYVNRRFGAVLEDVGTASITLYETRPDLLGSVEYFITNPENGVPQTLLGVGSFEEATHEYDAMELTAAKRFANNWGIQASYRLSRLNGNYEGFYRNDNGQSDPGITSLFDFPTNDPTYAQLAPELGWRGDIRYLGAAGEGPLPNDRRHQAKIYGNYAFNWGLNLGAGINFTSGSPLTALAANPIYDSAGEIPETPRGGGFETVDGFKTRTPNIWNTDLHADYGFRLGANRRVVVLADFFNLFNTQRVTAYDDYTEIGSHAPNPDFGSRLAYQTPRQVRIGARFEF